MSIHSRCQTYKTAQDWITQEFDAVNFAKTQKKLEAMMDLFLDSDQKLITELSYKNTLNGLANIETRDICSELPLLISRSLKRTSEYKSSLNEFIERISHKDLSDIYTKLLKKRSESKFD